MFHLTKIPDHLPNRLFLILRNQVSNLVGMHGYSICATHLAVGSESHGGVQLCKEKPS